MELIWWVVIAAVSVGVFMFIDTKFLKIGRSKSRQARILLFEKIGDEKVFKKSIIAPIKNDDKLGFYIQLTKKVAIPVTNPKDFYYDSRVERCLQVIKYGPDDFRPISRLDKGVWGKLEEKEQLKLNPETKEPIHILDSEGKKLKDDKGEFLYETEMAQVLNYYEEPQGVTQLAREGVRFNRAFQKRMDELRKEKQTWWDQHGVQVLSIGVVVIFMIFTVYQMNSFRTDVKEYTKAATEEIGKAAAAINQPHWATGLIDKVNRKTNEENTPLT